jgi:hypothetical protein
VPDLTARVDDVLISPEGVLAQRAHHSRVHGCRTTLNTAAEESSRPGKC